MKEEIVRRVHAGRTREMGPCTGEWEGEGESWNKQSEVDYV